MQAEQSTSVDSQQLRKDIQSRLQEVLEKAGVGVTSVLFVDEAVSTFHTLQREADVAASLLTAAGWRRVRVLPTHGGTWLATARV